MTIRPLKRVTNQTRIEPSIFAEATNPEQLCGLSYVVANLGTEVSPTTSNRAVYRRLLLCICKLVIELDGESHEGRNLRRVTEHLEKLGLKYSCYER